MGKYVRKRLQHYTRFVVVQERPRAAYQGCNHLFFRIFDVYERELALTACNFAHFQVRSTSSRTTRRARCRAAPDVRARSGRGSVASGYCGWHRST